MIEAAHRRVSLFRELMRDPHRFSSLIRKDIELLFDAMRSTPDPYEAVSWEAAVGMLADVEGTTRAILAEPALASIEAAVVGASLGRQGPWSAAYNADRALARCAYVVCRLVRPTVAVETGVAYGVTSAYILAALEVNSYGTLHSIDLPPLGGDASWVGAFVPARLRSRWHLHVGLSRAKLPQILALGQVDFFMHDSLHTYSTMRWELTSAWASLRAGGAMIADDIESNDAFREVSAEPEVAYAVAVRSESKAGSVFGVIRRR